MHIVHLWVALGIFLLGVGTGALTTFALNVKQIHHLKRLLEAETNSQAKEQEQRQESNGRKSA
jgi:Na+/alanine symporter